MDFLHKIVNQNYKEIKLKNLMMIFVLVFFAVNACGGDTLGDNLNWTTNLEQAIAQAKKENKAVLVNFTGSDWCVWCKKLSGEVFSQDEFAAYAKENLILVMLDFPRSIEQSDKIKAYNQSLAQKYGIQGFPTILIFNSSGNMVAKTGYQQGGAANYVKHIESYL